MSTVVYKNGIRFSVNTKEAPHKGRPHCSVTRGNAEMVVDLNTLELLHNNGEFTKADWKEIKEALAHYQDELLEKWSEYHGKK